MIEMERTQSLLTTIHTVVRYLSEVASRALPTADLVKDSVPDLRFYIGSGVHTVG